MNENNLIYFHIIIILLQWYPLGNGGGSNVCQWAGSVFVGWGGADGAGDCSSYVMWMMRHGKGYCRGRDKQGRRVIFMAIGLGHRIYKGWRVSFSVTHLFT